MKYTDEQRIAKIVVLCEKLLTYLRENQLTPEDVMKQEYTQWAITTPLYNIGEQVYRLSPELKARFPELPWNMVSGMRHRLVHDYEGVNRQLIWEIISEDLPALIDALKKLAQTEENT